MNPIFRGSELHEQQLVPQLCSMSNSDG